MCGSDLADGKRSCCHAAPSTPSLCDLVCCLKHLWPCCFAMKKWVNIRSVRRGFARSIFFASSSFRLLVCPEAGAYTLACRVGCSVAMLYPLVCPEAGAGEFLLPRVCSGAGLTLQRSGEPRGGICQGPGRGMIVVHALYIHVLVTW